MPLGGSGGDVENHTHRMLATEYGIIGYTPAEPQKNHLRSGEKHANACAARLVTDTTQFADRPVQAFQGRLGENALVLISILTCNGSRIEDIFTKLSQGGKAWGRIEQERIQAKEAGNAMMALDSAEHAVVARTQIHGFWSDVDHSDVEKVNAEAVMGLVREYNDVAPSCADRLVALNLLRKADRIISDVGLVGQTQEARKLRVLTMNNLASQWRRRGRLTDAQKCLQTAQVLAGALGAPPTKNKSAHHTIEHAICVITVRAEGLQNLDDNGLGGLSDPFLRINRTVNAAENAKYTRKLTQKHSGKKGGLSLRSWHGAMDAVVVKTKEKEGKTVYKSEVVMNTLAPKWKRIRLMSSQLCGCDLDRPISLAALDWDKGGTHDVIGVAQLSFLEMQQRVRSKEPVALVAEDTATDGLATLGLTGATGLLFFEEAWVSNVEGERLQMLRGETLLQRASVKWCLNQHLDALRDTRSALDELLSDRNLGSEAYAKKMTEDALTQLIRGRKVEASLLLIMCFESSTALAVQCGKDHTGYHHNAIHLIRLLKVGYESGIIKYKQDTENVAQHGGDASSGDIWMDTVNETVSDAKTKLRSFERIVADYRVRCLPEAAVKSKKMKKMQSGPTGFLGLGAGGKTGKTSVTKSERQLVRKLRAERSGSAPAVRSHAKPKAGVVPYCDSLGRSLEGWAVKRGQGIGAPPGPDSPGKRRPATAGSRSHPVLPRGGSASRLRALSRSQGFISQFPMSAEWLSQSRPSTAGRQRSPSGPSPQQVRQQSSGWMQRPATAPQRDRAARAAFAKVHGKHSTEFATSGLLATAY